MAILLKAVQRFYEVPIKLHMTFLKDIDQMMLRFLWSNKVSQISNSRKKEDDGLLFPTHIKLNMNLPYDPEILLKDR